jgi:formylglycine-generating enzyme required for sulfatase activity/murein DD-endopeptidase MepM/ murein hydrolase activator NlpD
MKNRIPQKAVLGIVALCALTTPCFSASVQLRMVPSTNGPLLMADWVSEPGALFVFQTPTLPILANNTTTFFQTNTPANVSLAAKPASSATSQNFFFAVQWPGRSVDEFGSPEYDLDQPSPGMILITSGLPDNLAAGQVFLVDFFVTDPTGQLLTVSGPVQIFVVRRTDGALHPDAQVLPAAQQLVGGHLRAQIYLQSTTSLDGYTLGIGPVTSGGTKIGVLPAAFNLGSNPLPTPSAAALLQILENARSSAIDPNGLWSCPLPPGTNYSVGGTFGEWRGKFNQEVHTGLDLVTAPNTSVLASRGGIVSYLATLPDTGSSIVIDHGDGWFSCYAELDANSIVVAPGQAVLRGAALATGLSVAGGGLVHLHFEVRRDGGQAQWAVAQPGGSQDPLQTPGIFSVAPGTTVPTLEEVGLSRNHPGQQPFVKAPPDANGTSGLIYLFARLADTGMRGGGGEYHLGLRSVSFQADGMSQPLTIQPSNDTAIARLRIPGTGSPMGFATYDLLHAINPDPLNWYPYWWAWSTAAYASNPIGPRTVQVIGLSYGGAAVTNALSFGPEIQNNVWVPLGAGSFKVTVVAHLGSTNLAPQCAQPDQYKLEVLHADKTTMAGAQWSGTVPGNYSKVFSNHLDAVDYVFQIPAGESATNMVVRASSLMAPDLRHEVSQGVVQLLGRASNAPALVDIPAGTFVMGSPASEAERFDCEGPQTIVTISHCFKMGKYAVTQAQYKSVAGSNPSYFSGVSNRPVEQVSWSDATNYCFQLTRLEQQAGFLPAGWAYRLPTEAEREYACRAGSTTAFYYGPALRSGVANFNGHYEYAATLGTVSNPNGIFLGMPVPVGGYVPNAWGLFDLHANVWEWCLDWWGSSLPGGSAVDPRGPAVGSDRVIRGGGWYNDATFCRSAFRLRSSPAYRGNDTGFRVVLAPSQL